MSPDTDKPADPIATDAAAAHAEKTGVDLAAVEGTGKDGTIIKADVVAAAVGDAAPDRPAVGTPALEKVIDSVIQLGANELDLVHAALESELYRRRTESAS